MATNYGMVVAYNRYAYSEIFMIHDSCDFVRSCNSKYLYIHNTTGAMGTKHGKVMTYSEELLPIYSHNL